MTERIGIRSETNAVRQSGWSGRGDEVFCDSSIHQLAKLCSQVDAKLVHAAAARVSRHFGDPRLAYPRPLPAGPRRRSFWLGMVDACFVEAAHAVVELGSKRDEREREGGAAGFAKTQA